MSRSSSSWRSAWPGCRRTRSSRTARRRGSTAAAIRLDQASGQWQIALQVHDASGDWGYRDEGQAEVDGETVWFDSQISGTSYAGTVSGTEVKIMYDWCYNGVPDVQLVFAR